jgi:hypothetical protein
MLPRPSAKPANLRQATGNGFTLSKYDDASFYQTNTAITEHHRIAHSVLIGFHWLCYAAEDPLTACVPQSLSLDYHWMGFTPGILGALRLHS